jgi:alkylation response protein AidB-like acyl-CoA dehydrogenase
MLRPETAAERAFRAEVRAWFEAELPPALRDLTFRPPRDKIMPWFKRLSQRGWIAPHWPRAEGGMDATPVQQIILIEEAARIGAPDLPTQGINQIGPILQRFGTPGQRARHLPPILAGDVLWCQGYSEPEAGSDLAALRTRGVVEGAEIVVTGQKIWNTWAHNADWMYALVRSNETAPKRQNITFLLIDLTTPGIVRRPIRTIAGDEELCEVFFDRVRVPLENVVGEIDKGWDIVNALLANERVQIGSPAHALRALRRVHRAAEVLGPDFDQGRQDKCAQAEIEAAALTAAFLQALEGLEAGLACDASSLKILASETTQFILDIAQDLCGPAAALKEPERIGGGVLDFSEHFLQSRRLSIYGGTNEIQRGLIAMRILDLPRGR